MSIGRIPGNTLGINTPTASPYSSGQSYAQEIAGGMPMEQVIAPGVSYSPEQPGGYTQAELNAIAQPVPTTPIPVPPPTPPVVPPTPPTITPPTPPVIPPGYFLPPEISIPPGISQLDMPIIPEGMRELIEGIDMKNIEEILARIEQPKDIPSVDLTGIEKRLSALETMPQPERISIENIREGLLADIPTFTPRTDEEILGLMGGVQQPAFDPTGIESRLRELESRPDYDPMQYSNLKPQRTYIDDQPLPLGLL